MRWVRMALVPLVLVAFVSSAFAQGAGTASTTPPAAAKSMTAKSPEDMAKEAMAKWKTTLKLTDEQVPQFESVMTDSYTKMAAAKTEAAGDKAKMKASMQAIMKDRAEALSKVLTPEQMKTYEEHMKKNVSAVKKHMAETK